jgi:hypothetical protein
MQKVTIGVTTYADTKGGLRIALRLLIGESLYIFLVVVSQILQWFAMIFRYIVASKVHVHNLDSARDNELPMMTFKKHA